MICTTPSSVFVVCGISERSSIENNGYIVMFLGFLRYKAIDFYIEIFFNGFVIIGIIVIANKMLPNTLSNFKESGLCFAHWITKMYSFELS